MTVARQITDYAGSLFDVVGVTHLSSGESLLILGLESTSERNLDEFGRLNGAFHLYGFEKHIGPKLESLLNLIQEKGSSAEPVGQYGYPLGGEINLKEEAIRAGLVKRGKSTIVLHPEYGPRLRLIAIRTDAPLEPPIYSALTEEENPLCNGCSICIDACPVNALKPYSMPDPSICLSNSAIMAEEQGRLVPCDICLNLCPVAKMY
ncbi:MAG TPA: 4Fe-4S binding protein [Dehalococcoidia bacterium]|nr:4Fe-4S binding protein [Dehalococcoidia bacterium]